MTCTFSKGQSIILNSGSLNQSSLGKPDKYGKYSTAYVMGLGNRSFQELKKMVARMTEGKDYKMPWRVDENTNMVSVFASNVKPIPVDGDADRARDGEFCKINVTPATYAFDELVNYRLPDGSAGKNSVRREGVKLFLNGVKTTTKDEELF